MDRRMFIGLFAAMPAAFKLDLAKLEAKKAAIKPLTTIHPAYIGPSVLPEGWYNTTIVDVIPTESKLTGNPIYNVVLKTDSGKKIYNFFDPNRTRWHLANFLDKVKMIDKTKPLETQSVDLADCIGKQIRVHVEVRPVHGKSKDGSLIEKECNRVDEYIALEE